CVIRRVLANRLDSVERGRLGRVHLALEDGFAVTCLQTEVDLAVAGCLHHELAGHVTAPPMGVATLPNSSGRRSGRSLQRSGPTPVLIESSVLERTHGLGSARARLCDFPITGVRYTWRDVVSTPPPLREKNLALGHSAGVDLRL